MEDPYEVLGVAPESDPERVRAVYRELVRASHPDRHVADGVAARAARHTRMAEINAAYRMLNDPTELERFRRLQRRRARGRASEEPGADGVRFTAADPRAGGSIEPAPGDPDFDYRQRAWREFNVAAPPPEPEMWTSRPPKRRRPRG